MKNLLPCMLTAALVGAVLGVASILAQGPLPADVAITRALQAAFGDNPPWAFFLTKTAKFPLVWLTLALCVAMAYVRGGWRGAVAPPVVFLVVLLADRILRVLIFVPRPSDEFVTVASISASSGLPSTFALVYGGVFGATLFASGRKGAGAAVAGAVSAGLIAAGLCARIVLGGHWASQMLSSLLLALALATIPYWILRAHPIRGDNDEAG